VAAAGPTRTEMGQEDDAGNCADLLFSGMSREAQQEITFAGMLVATGAARNISLQGCRFVEGVQMIKCLHPPSLALLEGVQTTTCPPSPLLAPHWPSPADALVSEHRFVISTLAPVAAAPLAPLALVMFLFPLPPLGTHHKPNHQGWAYCGGYLKARVAQDILMEELLRERGQDQQALPRFTLEVVFVCR
jgi:hypothetical protein